MDTYINPCGKMTYYLRNKIKIFRNIFDGKFAGMISGAGGAHCQLCIATSKQYQDV